MPQSPALDIEDLTVSYGPHVAVNDLSLTAGPGAITAVLGPNGAGKTTTLECAEGLRTPTAGRISVLGRPAGSPAARALTGVMLQDGGLPMSRSCGDVLQLAAHLTGASRDRVATLSSLLDLDPAAKTAVRRLSGGQRQRLSFAVAIMGGPRLVFLDEPSAGLDPHGRARVWDIIRELRENGTAVVLTTHLLSEAEALADVVHVLVNGAIRATGSPRELIAAHAGNDTLRVTLRRPVTDLELEELRALVSPATLEMNGELLEARNLPAQGAETAAQIARWCADRSAPILSLVAGGGTLEHAYLNLTGSRAADLLTDEEVDS